MWIIRTFLILLLIGLILGFIAFNLKEQVNIEFFGMQYPQVSIVYVIFSCFVIGMLVTFVLVIFVVLKAKTELRDERKENKRLLEEIGALRNMPLEEFEERTDSGA